MAQKLNFTETHWAIDPQGKAHLFGTKFLGPTNTKGSRLVYAEIFPHLDRVSRKKIVSWSHSAGLGEDGQLSYHLGEGWKVLNWWEVFEAIEAFCHIKAAKG